MQINLKRAYEAPAEADGYRVLIDRLWPRGMKKETAGIDNWAKSMAPSSELRKWFGHEEAKFSEFSRRYRSELLANPAFESFCRQLSAYPTVTLLYAAKDEQHNNAVVMKALLEECVKEYPNK